MVTVPLLDRTGKNLQQHLREKRHHRPRALLGSHVLGQNLNPGQDPSPRIRTSPLQGHHHLEEDPDLDLAQDQGVTGGIGQGSLFYTLFLF